MGIILAQTTNNKIPLKRAKDWGITRLRNMEAQLKPQGISNKESFVSTNRRQNTNEKKNEKKQPKSQAGIKTWARWQKLSLFVPGGALLMAGTVAVPKFIPAARRHRQHAHRMYIDTEHNIKHALPKHVHWYNTEVFAFLLAVVSKETASCLFNHQQNKKRNGQQMND